MTLPATLRALCADTRVARYLPLALSLLVGAVVLGPLVAAPRYYDDFFHLAWRSGWLPTHRAAWDLFRFVDVGEAAILRDHGVAPWFVETDARGGMFRPLTSLTIALDAWLFGARAGAAHLHSFLWWAVLVACVDRWLRGVGGSTGERAMVLCGFASGVFAVGPVGWIANRGVLMSGVFALVALTRTLEVSSMSRSVAAVAGWSLLSALCGEYSLCWTALAVCVVARGAQPVARRIAGVAAMAVPTLVVFALGSARGGGLSAGVYIRPFDEPARFLHELVPRYLLHASQYTTPFARAVLGSAADHPVVALALVILGHIGLAVLAWRHRSRSDLRGIAIGALAAVVPVLVAPPNPRLLFPASLGIWALLGIGAQGSRARFAIGWALVMVGGWQAATLSRATVAEQRAWQDTVTSTRSRLGVLSGRSVLAFVDDDLETWFRVPIAWRLVPLAPPSRTVGATFGALPDRIERLGPRSLGVYGTGLVSAGLRALRRGQRPFRAGASVHTAGATFTIEETRGESVTRLRVDTDHDLDGRWQLVVVRGPRVSALPTPRVGESCGVRLSVGGARCIVAHPR